jgi:hypothetical protein
MPWEKATGDPLRQRRIPGIVDLFEVSDPSQIKKLANEPIADRIFDSRTCPINWFLLKRSTAVLSYKGQRFPTMEPRLCEKRSRAQDELWRKLNDQAFTVRAGPIELAPLGEWVKGAGSEAAVGMLAQQVLGRLFRTDFTATPESWAAALVLVAAPRSPNLAKMCWWFITGKVRRSKSILANMVGDDLSAVNAIGIAVHNLAKSLRQMRLLYADVDSRKVLSAEVAAEKCLRAPVSVYRQATAKGVLDGTAFPKNSLFVLKIGEASQLAGGRPLVFMEDSWSRCPASTWIPAMLEGVWRRAAG